jgi:hypothetical protein
MLKGGAVRATRSSSYSSNGVWRSQVTLHLTMLGESNEEAVLALTNRCRQMILGTHLEAPVVVIDTSRVTGLAVSPGFMGACRDFLTLLKAKGATVVFGVSDNAAVRGVASAVGFGAGIRLRITPTLGEALALADEEAERFVQKQAAAK